MANQKVRTFTGTASEYRAKLDERRPYCDAIAEAVARGDMAGAAAAQKAMRDAFPSNAIE